MISRAGSALLAVHSTDHYPIDQAAGRKFGHIQLQLEGYAPSNAQIKQAPVGLPIGLAVRSDG